MIIVLITLSANLRKTEYKEAYESTENTVRYKTFPLFQISSASPILLLRVTCKF